MYAFLTEQVDKTFNLPERWTGTQVDTDLRELFDGTLSKGLFIFPVTDANRAALGFFLMVEAPRQAGKNHTVIAPTFDGTAVQENITSIDDPNYADQLAQDITGKLKAEAGRLILAIVPEWKQRNLLAQATMLSEKGRPNWTSAQLTTWDAGEAIWSQIEIIRTKSDTLEASLTAMDVAALEAFDPLAEMNS